MRICLDLRYKTESGGSTYVKQIAKKLVSMDKGNTYVIVKYRKNFIADLLDHGKKLHSV